VDKQVHFIHALAPIGELLDGLRVAAMRVQVLASFVFEGVEEGLGDEIC
jgi:hypothetical protein